MLLRQFTAIILLLSQALVLSAQSVRVHTRADMNKTPHETNSHAGDEQFSSLEKVWSHTLFLSSAKVMPSGLPDEQKDPWYPRVKALPDGTFVMFYQGGQVSSRILCSYSDNLLDWNGKKVLSQPKSVKIDGKDDFERYCNMEAAVLANGTLLGVQAFRSSYAYSSTGHGCGIRATRSHDNGHTWTKPNVIYEGPCWEPYILELPDGTVQVYFTDCDPRSRNSGTSLIESKDGGVSFGPKKRVCRQFKYYWKGQKIFTDQMPVMRVLNDGKTIVGALEARIEPEGAEANLPGGKSEYWISLVRNEGPDWKDIGEEGEGPATRSTNVLRSNSAYLVTLPSGEVVLSTGIEGSHSLKIGDHTATRWNSRNWESGWYQPFQGRGCWGSIEATHDKHHIISVMDAGNGGGIRMALSYLNHRISAPLAKIVPDGRTDEWKCDEALFIGSESPVETVFRAANDGENLFIAAEWVNAADAALQSIGISLCNSSAKLRKGSSLSLVISPEGLVSATDPSVKAHSLPGKTYDGRRGGICEICIPLASISSANDARVFFNAEITVDNAGKTVRDGFWQAGRNPSSWQCIQLTQEPQPQPFMASHSSDEQFSVLQPMPSYSQLLPPEFCLKGLPESAEEQKFACYPRIKRLASGEYLMLWMGGRFGSRIWYSISPDLKTWSEATLLFEPYRKQMDDGTTDIVRFVNPDAVVLPNGEVLMVCSFRAANHYSKGIGGGLVTRRSSDNGRTWSEPQVICDIANWEPYLLLLPDGRLQCYFTHAVPQLWNSGTSVMTSTDSGHSWSRAIRCCRQFKYVYQGHNIYTDQMPCFRVLADGKTLAGYLESRNETKVPLDYKDKNYYASYCKMSMVYNDSLDWKDLGDDSAGPARRHTNVAKGAGGYIVTFPSGEVVVGRGLSSKYSMKILTSDAELVPSDNWSANWTLAVPDDGYWGTMEVDSPSTLVAAMHSESSKGIQIARFHLNHRIDAPLGHFSSDSLYLGARNGAEAFITASRSDSSLVLRIDISGEFNSLQLRLCGLGEKKIWQKTLTSGGEVSIPLSELGNPVDGDHICIFASLSAGGSNVSFSRSVITKPQTWQRIRLKN